MGSAGTKSGAEDAFLRLDLPEPLVNMHLLGREVDFHWPEPASSWRSTASTASRGRVADDAGRDAVLAAAGLRPSCASQRRGRPPAAGRGHRSSRRGVASSRVFGVRLEHAVDEPALRRRDQKLLEQELAARIVVGVVGVDEHDLEHAVPVAVRGDRGGRAWLPLAASHSQTIRCRPRGRGVTDCNRVRRWSWNCGRPRSRSSSRTTGRPRTCTSWTTGAGRSSRSSTRCTSTTPPTSATATRWTCRSCGRPTCRPAALLIDGVAVAMADFTAPRFMCRSEFPPPGADAPVDDARLGPGGVRRGRFG